VVILQVEVVVEEMLLMEDLLQMLLVVQVVVDRRIGLQELPELLIVVEVVVVPLIQALEDLVDPVLLL
jgi:hypothetical protein